MMNSLQRISNYANFSYLPYDFIIFPNQVQPNYILHICLTSVTRAKLNDKMAFPA